MAFDGLRQLEGAHDRGVWGQTHESAFAGPRPLPFAGPVSGHIRRACRVCRQRANLIIPDSASNFPAWTESRWMGWSLFWTLYLKSLDITGARLEQHSGPSGAQKE